METKTRNTIELNPLWIHELQVPCTSGVVGLTLCPGAGMVSL